MSDDISSKVKKIVADHLELMSQKLTKILALSMI